MPLASSSKTIAGVLAAMALCGSSTGAIAATPIQAAVSPFVALSALGSEVSAAALCGSSTVAGSAAQAQGSPQGCVLPTGDQASPAVAGNMPPPVAVEPYAPVGGAAVSPLLLALVGIAGAVALYYLVFRGNDNFHIVFPSSPS